MPLYRDGRAIDTLMSGACLFRSCPWPLTWHGHSSPHSTGLLIETRIRCSPAPSAAHLRSRAGHQAFAATEKPAPPIPDMRTDKDGWYRYWDEDNDGTLQQEEVVRALLKTLKLTTNQDRVRQMRETIAAIWPIFDTDGSGSVDQEEFLR